MISLPAIDTNLLIRNVPKLSAVKWGKQPWSEVGDDLARQMLDTESELKTGSRVWLRTRIEIYALLGTKDAGHQLMRNRLERHPPSTTTDLMAQLVPWLAEVIGIPLVVASALVSIALFLLAEESVQSLLPSGAEQVG